MYIRRSAHLKYNLNTRKCVFKANLSGLNCEAKFCEEHRAY